MYTPAGFDYTSMNLEQQAQIVSDWFLGSANDTISHKTAKYQSVTGKDTSSPYFAYITGNLRIGLF